MKITKELILEGIVSIFGIIGILFVGALGYNITITVDKNKKPKK